MFEVRKNTESKNMRFAKTNKRKLMLLSKCALCDRKKLRFIKYQEASGSLYNFGLKTPLSKIPVLVGILFQRYQMNEIFNKFLLRGSKFMPEIHLKLFGFSFSACGPFTENKQRIQF